MSMRFSAGRANEMESRLVDPERASFLGNRTTAGIVAGVLLAVVMVAGEQIGERIDTVLLGGVFPLFGIVIHMICNMTAVVAYGLISALIVATLNPFIAIATGTGPMAPLWFFTNAGASLGGRVVHYWLIRKDVREMSLMHTFLVCLGGMAVNSAVMTPVQLFYFRMPWKLVVGMKAAEIAAGTILPAMTAWKAGRALKCIHEA